MLKNAITFSKKKTVLALLASEKTYFGFQKKTKKNNYFGENLEPLGRPSQFNSIVFRHGCYKLHLWQMGIDTVNE